MDIKLVRDIQSLSTFKRNTSRLLSQLKKTKEPVILTVNGKAELVVQDAGSYQHLWDAKMRTEAINAIKQGLADIQKGQGTEAKKFFAEFFTKNKISKIKRSFIK